MPTRRRAQRSRILSLLDRFEPALARAFREAIDGIRDTAILAEVEAAIASGQAEAVARALRLDRAAFLSLETGISNAYTQVGVDTASAISRTRPPPGRGQRVLIRFDLRNPAAETWLRQHSSTLVTRIVADQQAAIRVVLQDGMARGINPRGTALDLIGRINKVTGRREGGLIGLTRQQAEYVVNARMELESGSKNALSKYLSRQRRDKRFDRSVLKAIKTGEPIPKDIINKATQRYSDSLLQLRGESIARSEMLEGLHAAQHEAFRQTVESGQVRAEQIVREWSSSGDGRVRDDHREMDGQTVGFNEPFTFPDGSRAMYPGDTSLGAPPEQTVFCRCWADERIDFLAGLE